MKNLIIALLMLIPLITTNSCKKDTVEIVSNDISAEKVDVKTFEIINVITQSTLRNNYIGTFGSEAIELKKTSDSTLTFYIPEIPAGEAVLKFELGSIKFNVTQSQEIDPNVLISDLIQNFQSQVAILNPVTPSEIAEVNTITSYRNEVINLFNSLSVDERRKASLFYIANKHLFKLFANNTFINLDTTTTYKFQSDCPRLNFKAFYSCTAENLGIAATELKNSSKKFLTMLFLAGTSAYLSPASFGLSAIGTALAVGTAGYLLITEVKPAVLHFKHSLFPFLEANWIFGKALFISTTLVFQDQVNTSLNLNAKFHSFTSNDGDMNSSSSFFVSSMNMLKEYWNKLIPVFGFFPEYSNTEFVADLETNEVAISEISNSNVQFQGNTGSEVKFKSLSGNDENFNYSIKVNKEGFIREARLAAKILAFTDSSTLYKASAIGNYDITDWVGNGPNSILKCELKAGGIAIYKIYNDPAWPNGYTWTSNWILHYVNNRYHITTSFSNPGHQINEAQPLNFPVTSFIYIHRYIK